MKEFIHFDVTYKKGKWFLDCAWYDADDKSSIRRHNEEITDVGLLDRLDNLKGNTQAMIMATKEHLNDIIQNFEMVS